MGSRLPAITLAVALLAQKPEAEQPVTIQVDVDLVNILGSVRDKKNALVTTLTKDDFLIREDGKDQTIRYFAHETDLPFTMGVLVDVSISQENLIEVEKRAADQFFRQVLRPKDMAFLISFGADTELLQDLTNSTKLLRAGLDQLRLSGGAQGIHPSPVPTSAPPRGTLLYEAVYLAANEKLKGEVGRKAIIVISDGVDFGSRIKAEEAIEAAQKSDAIIYSIHYMDYGRYNRFGGIGVSDSSLRKMSEETGGRFFHVDRGNPLDAIFSRIQEEMRSQYALGYASTNPERDGRFRKIEIRTKNKDLKVQARKGYYAQKPEHR